MLALARNKTGHLFFSAERSLPECLPGPPVEPIRYAVVGLELLQDLVSCSASQCDAIGQLIICFGEGCDAHKTKLGSQTEEPKGTKLSMDVF